VLDPGDPGEQDRQPDGQPGPQAVAEPDARGVQLGLERGPRALDQGCGLAAGAFHCASGDGAAVTERPATTAASTATASAAMASRRGSAPPLKPSSTSSARPPDRRRAAVQRPSACR
jgi:hypothetical protein